jgi:hypothetical protein
MNHGGIGNPLAQGFDSLALAASGPAPAFVVAPTGRDPPHTCIKTQPIRIEGKPNIVNPLKTV